jgi:predicted XRE-type DNA-binding protein
VDRIRFPNLDANDSDTYQYLAEQKDELLNSGFFDADKLQEDDSEDEDDGTLSDTDKEKIKGMAKTTSATQEEIAEVFDIGRSTVSKVKNDTL